MLVDWVSVPAESITELVGDGLATTIVLNANHAEDVDPEDTGALIRTLRPIKEVHIIHMCAHDLVYLTSASGVLWCTFIYAFLFSANKHRANYVRRGWSLH